MGDDLVKSNQGRSADRLQDVVIYHALAV
jgi:hypothetical protein